ncbi:MAG: hypothetical protein ACFFDY_12645 [Candidatus Thorarchaeota archaeon]
MSLRCRACIRCKEYIVIHAGSPINQVEIKKFEKVHLGHTVVTAELNEVKDAYKSFKNHIAENSPQEAS